MFPASTAPVWPALLLAATLSLSACGGGGGGGGAGGGGGGGGSDTPQIPDPAADRVGAGAEPCGGPDLAAQALAAVNAARARAQVCRGSNHPAVPALGWDNRLALAAATQAADMATHDHVRHTDSRGQTLGPRVTATGYAWSAVSENLAAGPGTVDGAVQGWLGSSLGHCEGLMSNGVTQMGLACYRRAGSTYGSYWALVMARPR